MDNNCLFCRIVAGEIPARLLFADDEIIAFADVAPQAPVHLLIVPKRHLSHLFATGATEAALLGRMVTTATELARQAGLENASLENGGFRLVMNCLAGAGQSVVHLHLHLLGGRPLGWPPG
jgi:histidine triad (HIT) family protein